MRFKLVITLVDDTRVEAVLKAARDAGATGATVLTSGRGEGLKPQKTFFGLDLYSQRDMVLFVVEEHLSREIMERIAEAGGFETEPGSGIAFQIAIEDAIGLESQMQQLSRKIEDQI
ncbi:MAG: P-II family nitrogen regulator [Hyphomicrobiaceae bacterium]|nr:P-II family nitrogen regulator [Hyphomicrobiaceae bacterium]